MSLCYFDCIGGASGDMLLASLIDAGAPVERINHALLGLGVPGLRVGIGHATRHALRCTTVTVSWGAEPSVHHMHTDDHASDVAHHHGRSYRDIRAMVAGAGLAERVQGQALDVFRRLAAVEGRIHGVDPDEVHFHEVGSEDSIADVVGVCVALELLGIEVVECSPLPMGRGLITSAHGVLPLPAPATLELLHGIPVHGVDIAKELVTPTGAALLSALTTRFGGLPSMSVDRIGYGAGGRDLPERPNVVRALIGQSTTAPGGATAGEADANPTVMLIETNLDDCSPELIPDACSAMLDAGALDVWTAQVLMKKGRPGFVLHALARSEHARDVAHAMLRETSALGVRMCAYQRVELERRFVTVAVAGEPVSVKVGHSDGQLMNIAPEHDDCAAAAKVLGLPVKEVFTRALELARVELAAGESGGGSAAMTTTDGRQP